MTTIDLANQLVFHGSIALLVGMLCGWPMGRAINRNRGDDVVRSWRVAHSGLVLGGVLLFAIASVLPGITIGPLYDGILTWSFVISTYGFVIALPLGAMTGHRGLRLSPGYGGIVFLGNLVGAIGSLVGGCLVVYAAFIRAYA